MRKFGMWVSALLLTALVSAEASAQRRVTGRVTGAAGEPIASASINVQGTTIGAYSAEDGRYTLNNVPAGAQVIVARRIGYKRVNQPLTATSDAVDIKMEKDVLELERQVVTGTTTSISSANSANAVAAVSGAELNRAPTPTIENALQGKIAGAVISTNSGAPGGGAQVQLRGITSINAASSPLYVIDGVLVNNSQIANGLNSITAAGGGISSSQDQPTDRISDINPADIENIEVLKGASAGAIYGSKASNGVIIITTKQGTSGKPVVSFTQRAGQFTISHELGLRCYGSLAEAMGVAGDTALAHAQYTASGGACNDFEKQLYSGNPLSYETDLSVRGGSNGTSYYIGGLAKRDAAILRNTYYQKQSIQANIGQTIGSRLTIRANNQFIHSLTDRGISGNDNADISPVAVFSETPTYYNLSAEQPNPFSGVGSNPFQTADLVKAPEDVFRYIGAVTSTLSAYASQRQTLDFTFIAGLDTYAYNGNLYSPPEVFLEGPGDGLPGTVVDNRTNNTNANLNLSGAHKLIADKFTATTSFGLRQERRQSDALLNLARNLPSGVTDINFGVVQSTNETKTLIKDFAYYAQEEVLALNERLALTAAVNTERSSVNGDDAKWYSYPKFSASYRLPWLPKFTDEFKLRGAIGQAGNQPPYGFKFTTLPISFDDGQLGAAPSATAGSPSIKPETSRELEGGFDAQFAGGRIALDATVFQKKVSDLILSANIATTSGFSTKLINGGNLYTTGTELGLNVTPIQRNNFTWVSHATYASVNSQVTALSVPCFNAGSGFSLRFGLPYVCTGFSPSDVQVNSGFDTTAISPAGVVTRVRHVLNLESAPRFTMGFSNEFNIGPVRLYGLLDWRSGGYVANLTNNYFDAQSATGSLADTAAAHARNIAFSTAGGGYNVYLEPAGFVKLRELSMSFSLPKTVTSNIFSGTNDVRLEISGRNLKTWTKYTGYDPEVSNFSNQDVGRFQDVTPYPPSRSIFVSLSTNF